MTPPAITMMLTASKIPAYAKGGGSHVNAALGNGTETGDPGNSGAHNQAANAPASLGSSAAQNDPLHEIVDPNEPN